MSAKAATLIREACDAAALDGIRIKRGHLFDWTMRPLTCCALGAVMWAHADDPMDSFLPNVCRILGVDSFWVYRFIMGFDRNYQILILDDDNKVIGRDDVSRLGITIAKEKVVP